GTGRSGGAVGPAGAASSGAAGWLPPGGFPRGSMSRSRRKTPITGITSAGSEKADKRVANRRVRRSVRQSLTVSPAPHLLPHTRELSNPWTFAKDGKVYRGSRLTRAEWRK